MNNLKNILKKKTFYKLKINDDYGKLKRVSNQNIY